MTFGRNNATETTQKIVQGKKWLYFLHFWSNKGYFEGHFNPRKNTLYIIFLIYYYTGWVKKKVWLASSSSYLIFFMKFLFLVFLQYFVILSSFVWNWHGTTKKIRIFPSKSKVKKNKNVIVDKCYLILKSH